MSGLQGNRTLEILDKAEREGYGILAQTWCVVLSSTVEPHADTLFQL